MSSQRKGKYHGERGCGTDQKNEHVVRMGPPPRQKLSMGGQGFPVSTVWLNTHKKETFYGMGGAVSHQKMVRFVGTVGFLPDSKKDIDGDIGAVFSRNIYPYDAAASDTSDDAFDGRIEAAHGTYICLLYGAAALETNEVDCQDGFASEPETNSMDNECSAAVPSETNHSDGDINDDFSESKYRDRERP